MAQSRLLQRFDDTRTVFEDKDEPTWHVVLDLKDILELVVAPVHSDEISHILSAKSVNTARDTKSLFQTTVFSLNIIIWSNTLF